jgi:hypothetical protein
VLLLERTVFGLRFEITMSKWPRPKSQFLIDAELRSLIFRWWYDPCSGGLVSIVLARNPHADRAALLVTEIDYCKHRMYLPADRADLLVDMTYRCNSEP